MLDKFLSLPAPTHSTTLSHTVECWNLFSQTRKHASSPLYSRVLWLLHQSGGSQIPPVEILSLHTLAHTHTLSHPSLSRCVASIDETVNRIID
ncbi:hypothetical protein CDAR_52261 [Caerostris darwini]|uniref:Uncharacterized protein n=1 Tax=Caerostris darwini TaxID=1538125 RepID=A0AAV4V283_9ARAC|nr:hypothetical protein CDAR_52261 [Caerostris darwini]